MRRAPSLMFAAAATLAVGACDRPSPERANDTAVVTPPPPDSAVAPPLESTMWDSAAGPIFLVMGATSDQGAVVVPGIDTSASIDTIAIPVERFRALTLDLFRDGRLVTTGTAGDSIARDVPDDCSTWPLLRLARSDTAAWTIAFPTGRFSALGMDSLLALPSTDSVRLTRELARVASAAPGDTADAMRGLPYVVQRAWRGTLRSGRALVVAEIDRALNQEANPQHEHLLLVAERDSGATRWNPGWGERTLGGEEALASIDLLAAGYLRGRDEPVVFLARYLGDGVIYSMLSRERNGRWHVRWSSPYTGC